MNVFKKTIAAILFGLAVSGAQAAILGITPAEPLFIVSPSSAVLPNADYSVSGGSLSISGRVPGIRFGGSIIRISGGAMQISVLIDGAGNPQLPGTATDIVISGTATIDGVVYSGNLLTGQLQSYGISNTSAGDASETDRIDFVFSKTGGALSDWFGDFDIGVSSLANGVGIGAVLEASTYNGSFAVDWNASKFKANIGRIEREEILGMIGDFVWEDTNADGLNNDGTAIDGVGVMLFACNGNTLGAQLDNMSTASGGLYKFNNVAAGRYAVKFTAPTGYMFTLSNVGGNDAIDSDADQVSGVTACFDFDPAILMFDDTWDAGLYRPASLGDFVWNDLDEDGVQDNGEPGVNGVSVSLSVLDCSDDSVTTANFQTTSTANNGANDGAYQFTGLMPGCYKVTFSGLPAGFVFTVADNGPDTIDSDANPTTGMTGTITLDSGEDDPTNDAGIYEPATAQLGDFVWTDLNANGIQDGGDLGIDGATVELFACENDAPVPGVLDSQITGAGDMPDGGYLFDDLAPGAYAVKFTVPGSSYMFSPDSQGLDDALDSDAVVGGDPAMGISHCVTLDVGDVNLTVDAGIFQKAMIGDFVWLDTNRDGIQDAGENGINQVEVGLFNCVEGAKTGTAIATMFTGNGGTPPADGYYKFTDLVPGEYTVMFMAPNGLVFSPQDQGGDDAIDSDTDADGNAACTVLDSGENDPDWDAGLNPPAAPGINLVKKTNDTDNNSPTGPFIPVGDTVTWTYVVTNTGNEDLFGVALTDDLGTNPSSDQAVICYSDTGYTNVSDTLAVGGTLYCRLIDSNPGAITGQYMNMAEVCGNYGSEFEFSTICDDDPDHYYGATASIDIRKQNDDVTGMPGNLDDLRTVGLGSDVTFTITVTNTGDLDLENIAVSDLTNPDPADPGEIDDSNCIRALQNLPGFMEPDASYTFTCTITNITMDFINEACVDANVDGQSADDPAYQVMDCDASEIMVVAPGIDIEKATDNKNGVPQDADDPRGPGLFVGSTATFTYVVTNTGSEPVKDVVVTDDQGVAVSFVGGDDNNDNLLDIGEIWTYTGSATVTEGQYKNIATVDGKGNVSDTMVSDMDPSHHFGLIPSIDIEKATNGQDADAAPGVQLMLGDTATFTYAVTNTGNEGLKNIVVTDDNGTPGDSSDDFSPVFIGGDTNNDGFLNAGSGEVWTYQATRTVTAGQYTNNSDVAAAGRTTDQPVVDDDPSNHFGNTDPRISLVKVTSDGVQPDGDGIRVAEGAAISWKYTVKNVGNVPLENIALIDNKEGAITCPMTSLGVGDEMLCVQTGGVAGNVPYTNSAEVCADDATGATPADVAICDDDPSDYVVLLPNIDIEKATDNRLGVPQDADSPRGPGLLVGGTATFTYVVTTSGNEAVANVVVVDDAGTPGDTSDDFNPTFTGGDTDGDNQLDADETWTYTGSATVTKGQYTNKGTVTGAGAESSTDVMDMDPSNHFGLDPQIDIEKFTNGFDADAPTGPQIPVGGTATFTYAVDNPSNEGIKNVVVVDDNGTPGDTSDDFNPNPVLSGGFNVGDNDQDNVLDFDETWSYTASRTVTVGQYTNVSTVTGQGNNTNKDVSDTDPSNHFGQAPAIDIRKQAEDVNGVPTAFNDIRVFADGSDVSFEIVVKNTGAVDLINVSIDDGLVQSCNPSIGSTFTLAIGEERSFVCTTTNVVDSFVNEACVTANSVEGVPVSDCDKSDVEIIDIDIRKEAEGADSREFSPGDTVTFDIVVTNTGNEDLFNVVVTDAMAADCGRDIGFLAAGNMVAYTCSVQGIDAGFENIACVDGFRPAIEGEKVSDCDPSTVVILEVCDLTLDKMCFVTPPPPSSNFQCDKPIDSLTMIWTGSNTVWVRAWKGDVGSTSLGVKSVAPGEEITFDGFAGSPNDVFWEVFSDAGLNNKIGESNFHLSCSDDDMDGPEDCGKFEGNGKDNDGSMINLWKLEGIVDAQNTLDCTVDSTPVFADACEFTGQQLPSCENGDKPDTLTWRYDGGTGGDGDCADSTFYTIVDSGGDGHDDFSCSGSIDTSQAITVEDDDGNIYVVEPGESFTVNRDDIGSMILTQGNSSQPLTFHTSCSQPLEALATAGALTLEALDDRRGDREVQYAYTVTNNSTGAVSNIDVTDDKLGNIGSIASLGGNGESMTLYAQAFIAATTTNTAMAVGDLVGTDDCVAPNDSVTVMVTEPPRSCETDGKPTELEFTLGSGLCSDMNNSQGDKAKCSGGGKLDDISSVVMTKDPDKFAVNVSGDTFTIAYDNSPGDKMPSTIKFRVQDSDGTSHDYELHTSCSVPLAEGDVVGGLEITNFVPEY